MKRNLLLHKCQKFLKVCRIRVLKVMRNLTTYELIAVETYQTGFDTQLQSPIRRYRLKGWKVTVIRLQKETGFDANPVYVKMLKCQEEQRTLLKSVLENQCKCCHASPEAP